MELTSALRIPSNLKTKAVYVHKRGVYGFDANGGILILVIGIALLAFHAAHGGLTQNPGRENSPQDCFLNRPSNPFNY